MYELGLFSYLNGGSEHLVEFLKTNPQLKELHMSGRWFEDELIDKIAATLPNLRSLSFPGFYAKATNWMKLTALKLEYFNPGMIGIWHDEDVLAFVGGMPSLQRLTIPSLNRISKYYILRLFEALRNEFRHSESNRRLWVSQDDFLYFPLDASDECTNEAIEKFVNEMFKQERRVKEHC